MQASPKVETSALTSSVNDLLFTSLTPENPIVYRFIFDDKFPSIRSLHHRRKSILSRGSPLSRIPRSCMKISVGEIALGLSLKLKQHACRCGILSSSLRVLLPDAKDKYNSWAFKVSITSVCNQFTTLSILAMLSQPMNPLSKEEISELLRERMVMKTNPAAKDGF